MKYCYQESKWLEKSFEIRDDGLVYSSTKENERTIRYDDIKKVTLLSPMRNMYTCRLDTRDGKKAVIVSRAFVSLGEFEDRSEEYSRFVKELHNRLKDHSQIQYQAGSSAGFYFLGLGLPVLALLVVVVAVLAVMTGHRVPLSPFVGLLIVIPVGINFLRKGRGIAYRPDDLPPQYTAELPS